MFWDKPFALLGLLAAVGSAAPPLSKRVQNVDFNSANEKYVFFRADRLVFLGPP
jgi:hypothetical protein